MGSIAKGRIKNMESFKKIHNFYVAYTECGAFAEGYTTGFVGGCHISSIITDENEITRALE